MPDFEGQADFTMPGGLLKRLISQASSPSRRNKQRYVFKGVLFVAKGKKLDLISTDGRRLAQAKGDLISDELERTGPRRSCRPRRWR